MKSSGVVFCLPAYFKTCLVRVDYLIKESFKAIGEDLSKSVFNKEIGL